MRVRLTTVLASLVVWSSSTPAQSPAPAAPASGRAVTNLLARLGAPKSLDTLARAAELASLPEEERLVQHRDWALLAVVAQVTTGDALIDWGRLPPALPPSLRRPYLNDLRSLPYGPGRLAIVRPGE